jgi:hypothetical protein
MVCRVTMLLLLLLLDRSANENYDESSVIKKKKKGTMQIAKRSLRRTRAASFAPTIA